MVRIRMRIHFHTTGSSSDRPLFARSQSARESYVGSRPAGIVFASRSHSQSGGPIVGTELAWLMFALFAVIVAASRT